MVDGSVNLALLAIRLAEAQSTDLVLAWVGPGKDGGAVDFSQDTQRKQTSSLASWLTSIPGEVFAGISDCRLWRLPSAWVGDDLHALIKDTGTDLLMVDYSVIDKRGRRSEKTLSTAIPPAPSWYSRGPWRNAPKPF